MNTLDNISNRAAPSSLAIDIKDCISDLSIIILESFVWYFYLAFLTKYWNQSLTLLSSLVLIALTCFYILYILYIVHESKVNLIFPLYPCSFPYPLNITYIYNFFIKLLFILFGGHKSKFCLKIEFAGCVLGFSATKRCLQSAAMLQSCNLCCCRRCPRSAISCMLPISDGRWGNCATKRLGFLASCAASLSLALPLPSSPFSPSSALICSTDEN